MESFRKWFYKPKKDDTSLLAQFFYADEALNLVAAELDSFDGRKDPERCTSLVNHLRQCQDKVLVICSKIMNQLIPEERASRDFRVKFPDDVIQDNLAGQLWFGAECLAAGSSIMNRECESTAMRPLAKALTKSLENVRNLLREQCLRINANITSNYHLFNDKLLEALKIFDRLFAEFELSYVSAMVPVKTPKEYYLQQLVVVLFSETLQRALKNNLLTQEMVDDYDPALMFTIPRLAIVSGLLIFPDGPLCLDRVASDMSEMFRPFRALLFKIRELVHTLNKKELHTLERFLCSCEDPNIDFSDTNSCQKLEGLYSEDETKPEEGPQPRYDIINIEKQYEEQEADCESENAYESLSSSGNESDDEGDTLCDREKERLPTPFPSSNIPTTSDCEMTSPVDSGVSEVDKDNSENTTLSDRSPEMCQNEEETTTRRIFDLEMSPNEQLFTTSSIFIPNQGRRYASNWEDLSRMAVSESDSVSLQLPNSFVLNSNVSPESSYRIRTTTLSTLQTFEQDSVHRHRVMKGYRNRRKRRRYRKTTSHKEEDGDSLSSSCSGCVVSDSCSISSVTSSEVPDDEEIEMAIQAAQLAYKTETRSKFRCSEDLIHRLFVCIAGVADQLQTNFAGDLRNILKSVFLMNSTPQEEEEEEEEDKSEKETSSVSSAESNRIENAIEAWETTSQEIENSGEPQPNTSHNENEESEPHVEHKIERNSLENPPPWVPDVMAPNCMTCEAVFTLVRRRHHCRNCGKVFCAKCSSNSVPLPRYGHMKPVRVCNSCFLYKVTPFTIEEIPTQNAH